MKPRLPVPPLRRRRPLRPIRLLGCVLPVLAAIGCARAWPQALPPAAPAPAAALANGDFERADRADPARPLGWDKPDGLGVQWTMAPADAAGASHGRAIRMNTAISEQAMVAQWRKAGITQWDIPKPAPNAVAETYGLSYYSAPVAVKPGEAYRISFDFMGASGGGKVWVRGWGLFNGEKRRRYETVVFCRTKGGLWTQFCQVFHPTRSRPEVTEMRVMLYAYYPAGVYWFDNVRIEPADSPSKQVGGEALQTAADAATGS